MIRTPRSPLLSLLFAVLLAGGSTAYGQTTTTTTVSSSLNPAAYGVSVTFTATVTPSAATGTVSFYDGNTLLGAQPLAPASGNVALLTSSGFVGSHSITAVYSGDSNYAGSTSSALTQVVNNGTGSSVSLSSSANPSPAGNSVTFTATVTPSDATGTITFFDGGKLLGGATVSGGVASIVVQTLAAGAHSITATYSGDGTYRPSTSSPVSQTISQQ